MSECTCEGTEAVTFCKDCGIGSTIPSNLQEECLAKVDEEISNVQVWLEEADEVWTSETALDDARKHLRFLNALRTVIEKHLQEYESVSDSVWNRNPICSCGSHTFPCQTITDIKKELGI